MRRTTKPGQDNLISWQWSRWNPVWLILEISHHQAQTSAQKTLRMKKYLSRQATKTKDTEEAQKKGNLVLVLLKMGMILTKKIQTHQGFRNKGKGWFLQDDCQPFWGWLLSEWVIFCSALSWKRNVLELLETGRRYRDYRFGHNLFQTFCSSCQ